MKSISTTKKKKKTKHNPDHANAKLVGEKKL